MTTPPQPPKLTAYRASAPPVLSYQPKVTWRPANTCVQILSWCVDCGRGVWWTRRELTITAPAGQDVTYRLLTTVDPAYPATDEPRCYDCTAYRALPWWRRLITRRPQSPKEEA